MSKVVWITEDIKKELTEDTIFCTIDEMNTIINDYNTDSGISKNEIFILGFYLSSVRSKLMVRLNEYGRSSDRLLIDEVDELVKSIYSVDHNSSLIRQFHEEN